MPQKWESLVSILSTASHTVAFRGQSNSRPSWQWYFCGLEKALDHRARSHMGASSVVLHFITLKKAGNFHILIADSLTRSTHTCMRSHKFVKQIHFVGWGRNNPVRLIHLCPSLKYVYLLCSSLALGIAKCHDISISLVPKWTLNYPTICLSNWALAPGLHLADSFFSIVCTTTTLSCLCIDPSLSSSVISLLPVFSLLSMRASSVYGWNL